jgi:hypothetical protein
VGDIIMKWNCYEERNEIDGLENAELLSKKVMELCMDDHMKDTKCAGFGYSSLELHASQS